MQVSHFPVMELPKELQWNVVKYFLGATSIIEVGPNARNITTCPGSTILKVCRAFKDEFGTFFYKRTTFSFVYRLSLSKTLANSNFTGQGIQHMEMDYDLLCKTRFIELNKMSGLQTFDIVITIPARWSSYEQSDPMVRNGEVGGKIRQLLRTQTRSKLVRMDTADEATRVFLEGVNCTVTAEYWGSTNFPRGPVRRSSLHRR